MHALLHTIILGPVSADIDKTWEKFNYNPLDFFTGSLPCIFSLGEMFFVLTADGCRDNSIRGMKSKWCHRNGARKISKKRGVKERKWKRNPQKTDRWEGKIMSTLTIFSNLIPLLRSYQGISLFILSLLLGFEQQQLSALHLLHPPAHNSTAFLFKGVLDPSFRF